MELGDFILKRRTELKLTQEDLANAINKPKNYISRLETGKVKSIKSEYVTPLSRILKCERDILLRDDEGEFRDLVEEREKISKMTIEEQRAYREKRRREMNESRAKRKEEFLKKRQRDYDTIIEYNQYTGFKNVTPEDFYEEVKIMLDNSIGFEEKDKEYIMRTLEMICKEDK